MKKLKCGRTNMYTVSTSVFLKDALCMDFDGAEREGIIKAYPVLNPKSAVVAYFLSEELADSFCALVNSYTPVV
jgi:hypothetical protein